MTILFINNKFRSHWEIIESIIVKYKQFFNIPSVDKIYIQSLQNISFNSYINTKYEHVIFGKPIKYDYIVETTIYDADYNNINKTSCNTFYISHDISLRLENTPNVFFLTPLANRNYIKTDILPFKTHKVNTHVPIYIIQGNITSVRRNYKLLSILLSEDYDYDFKIKLLGQGRLPQELKKFSHRILLKNNLNFIDFHKEFLDGYCLLPLITKKSNPQYYSNKLTSSMNYVSGYGLKCLIDQDLQDIYNLKDVEIFKDEKDIVDAFKKTLKSFYKNKNSVSKCTV